MHVLKARARSIAHRWGPACVLSATEQAALGVRFDEEDDAVAETFVVRLGPGKADALDQMNGVATAVASSSSGTLFVLDDKGVLHAAGRRHKLAAARAIAPYAGGVALAAADRLWLFSGDGTQVTEGPALQARALASSSAGLIAACSDGRVVLVDARGAERELPMDASGHLATLAIDDDGRIAASSGRTMLTGDVTGGLRPTASAPFEIHCTAMHKGGPLLSSRAHGLFVVEDGRVNPLKPSLRAHTLSVKDGVLLAASDLFVATSDGDDWLTRDLAPFVRLADGRMPRFVQSEDPAGV